MGLCCLSVLEAKGLQWVFPGHIGGGPAAVPLGVRGSIPCFSSFERPCPWLWPLIHHQSQERHVCKSPSQSNPRPPSCPFKEPVISFTHQKTRVHLLNGISSARSLLPRMVTGAQVLGVGTWHRMGSLFSRDMGRVAICEARASEPSSSKSQNGVRREGQSKGLRTLPGLGRRTPLPGWRAAPGLPVGTMLALSPLLTGAVLRTAQEFGGSSALAFLWQIGCGDQVSPLNRLNISSLPHAFP